MQLTSAPLTAAEEADLLVRAKAGDHEAQQRLVTSQVPQLRHLAARYAGAKGGTVTTDDLVAAGMEAILRAIHTFDPARGTRFYTHWRYAAQEAMANEVAAGRSSTLTVPGTTLRKYRAAVRAAQAQLQATTPPPSPVSPHHPWVVEDPLVVATSRTIARARFGMTHETFDAVHFAVARGRSLDDSCSTFTGTNRGREGADGPLSAAGLRHGIASQAPLGVGPPRESSDAPIRAARALEALSERERRVIDLTVHTDEPLSDREAAEALGSTRATVQRTRTRAIDKMRAALIE